MKIRFITLEITTAAFFTINSDDYERMGALTFMNDPDNNIEFTSSYNSKIWGYDELTVCYNHLPDRLLQVLNTIWTSHSGDDYTVIWEKPEQIIDMPEKLIIGDTLR